MKENKKKIVLVTGASSGIGKETAKRLLAEGYKVYVVARRVEKMKDLEKLGAVALKLDITSDKEVVKIVKEIEKRDNGVDILINNAGFGSYGAMEDTSIQDARYQFEVNLFGLARLTQLILPYMRKQKSGKIINISSMGGKVYIPLGSWYHATKFALEGWSDCLRIEVAPFNIKVVIVEPGAIKTEFGDVVMGPLMKRSGNSAYSHQTNKLIKAFEASHKKGGLTHPSVIANVIYKAIESKKPKTRVVAGKYAKPMLFIKKWFGDRVFDKVVTRVF